MSQSLDQVYVHIIFSTKGRMNWIDEKIEPILFAYIGGICKNLKCIPIKVGGYLNHIHILCKISKDVTWPKLIEEIKSHSSKWIKSQGQQYQAFYWQAGYAVYSVNPDEADVLIKYIQNQKQHHQKENFNAELVRHLKSQRIEYKEKYLWD